MLQSMHLDEDEYLFKKILSLSIFLFRTCTPKETMRLLCYQNEINRFLA